MPFIVATLRTEIAQFFRQLHQGARRLFVSNLFYILAEPIFNIFVGAFIWRITGSLAYLGLYFAARFAFQVITFALNGLLLRFVHIRALFFIGTLLMGLGAASIVLFDFTNPASIIAYAALYSLSGFYWGNRNYLELQETASSDRKYFFSILSAAQWLSNIIIPFVAGWCIVLGPALGLYTKNEAYWGLFGFAFLLMVGTAFVVIEGRFTHSKPSAITRIWVRPFLNRRRTLSLARGAFDGVSFISVPLVLFLFGSEGVLGTLTAIAALCTALLFYIYGRMVDSRYQPRVLVLSNIVAFVCAGILAFFASPLAAVLYVLLAPAANSFFSVAAEPIFLGLTEQEMAGDMGLRYAFIVDNELFLNTGRIIGIVIVLGVAISTTVTAAFFISPVLAAAVQSIFLMFYFNKK